MQGGGGYRNSARWVWLAIIATLLALLKARWALMKTRRFAIAAERGRVDARRVHAWGFVSRIIVRSDGGVSRVCGQSGYITISILIIGPSLPSDALV